MNRYQRVAVAIAAVNLLLILLFPPFDYNSIATAFPPAFSGFYFAFNPPVHGQINSTLLMLEVMVVLVNAGPPGASTPTRRPTGSPIKSSTRHGFTE